MKSKEWQKQSKLNCISKKKILMLDNPCKKALDIIDKQHIRVYSLSKECDCVWTGLTPIEINKTVYSPCTGVDHIKAPKIVHLDEAWKQTVGKEITSTAEHTMSLMLQLAKQKRIQLSEKTVGIIGYGRIGKQVHEMLKGFNFKKIIIDALSYDELDIITIHIPLSLHAIDVSKMKENCLLINTSRQGVINIDLVKERLLNSNFGYADDFKNVVDLTGYGAIQTNHIGGNCIEAREKTDIYIAKELDKNDYWRCLCEPFREQRYNY